MHQTLVQMRSDESPQTCDSPLLAPTFRVGCFLKSTVPAFSSFSEQRASGRFARIDSRKKSYFHVTRCAAKGALQKGITGHFFFGFGHFFCELFFPLEGPGSHRGGDPRKMGKITKCHSKRQDYEANSPRFFDVTHMKSLRTIIPQEFPDVMITEVVC